MFYPDYETTRPDPGMLKDARMNARLSKEEAAQLCGLHRTTYCRQESGDSRVSVTAYRLLLARGGWLPPPFEGWKITQNMLWTPENVGYEPGEIQALPYMHAVIAELSSRLRQYEEQPAPAPEPSRVVVPLSLHSGKIVRISEKMKRR